jgi:uncharacterized protein YlxW (UPF0749 family)
MSDRSLPSRVTNRLRRLRSSAPVQVRDARIPRLRQRVNDLSQQVQKLSKRVEDLEAEVLEAHSQSRRVGEISDLVTELLVSEASRRDPEFQRIVDKYVRG